MISWIVAAVFMTGIAAILGFTGVAGEASDFARALFAVLLTVTLALTAWRIDRHKTQQARRKDRRH